MTLLLRHRHNTCAWPGTVVACPAPSDTLLSLSTFSCCYLFHSLTAALRSLQHEKELAERKIKIAEKKQQKKKPQLASKMGSTHRG